MPSSLTTPGSTLDLALLDSVDPGTDILESPADEPLLFEATYEPSGPYLPVAAAALPSLIRRVRVRRELFLFVRHREYELDAQVGGDADRGVLAEVKVGDGEYRRFYRPGAAEADRYLRPGNGGGFIFHAPDAECLTVPVAAAAITLFLLEERVLGGLALRRATHFDEEKRARVRVG
ncbi:hypothetical protein [Gryllotalpicola protaetiae]|uniref:Uncharacterized protein n=1 Tax=Gryllotalpicola protaetiae TaxID=2419771 RepID=A0A387BQV5_9MICO|nr:hypothetical protein [Gryllotalpicola protaetiae]AYG03410.1 hypothetical protein D7I44_07595 [Gryllotalpicola protaetiae]